MEHKKSESLHCAVVFERLGPYHIARLNALAKRVRVTAIEIVKKDSLYQWDVVDSSSVFKRVTLFSSEAYERKELAERMYSELNALKPDAIGVPSWGRPASWAAFRWGYTSRTATVVMTASQFRDNPRVWWKESIKRQMVGHCGAALVGGERQLDYVRRLGMPESNIFIGYDVVDNDFFANGAEIARSDRKNALSKLNLPEAFFLITCRFVPKKNILGLLTSYWIYRQSGAPGNWKLVILGDGPLRPEIERFIIERNLSEHVVLAGFKQYQELPQYYGLANAFVLTSTTEQWGLAVNEAMAAGLPVIISNACGCTPHLVKDGLNGLSFDCSDPQNLAECMKRMASGECDAKAMSAASREMVAKFTTDTFAEGFVCAAQVARNNIPTPRFLPSAIAGAMIRTAKKDAE